MRKIGGLIAVVLMALLVIVGCDNSTVTNDGNDEWINHVNGIIATQPDTSWFDHPASTDGKVYDLSTANEIWGLASLVMKGEDFDGATINLAKRTYDLSALSETMKAEGFPSLIGIGEREGDANAFAGTFNGNGATIKGVDLNYPAGYQEGTVDEAHESNMAVGFFGVVKGISGNPAVVTDLVFEDCTLVSTSNTTGIAVGYAENAEISKIVVKNCEITGPQGVGGVVGRLYEGGKITGCTVENTMISADADVVDYEGAKTGNYNAGGIVGCASYHTTAGDIVINNNEVTLTGDSKIVATDNYAGGIAGNAAKNVRIYGNTVTIDSVNQISVSSTPDPYTASTVCGGGSAKFESTTSAGEGNTVIIGGSSDTVTNKGPITL